MIVEFKGWIKIPDGECASHCDAEHYLVGELNTENENVDSAFERLHLSYSVWTKKGEPC